MPDSPVLNLPRLSPFRYYFGKRRYVARCAVEKNCVIVIGAEIGIFGFGYSHVHAAIACYGGHALTAHPLNSNLVEEQPKEGYGSGDYVAITAYKPSKI